jgi:hypothetical protein
MNEIEFKTSDVPVCDFCASENPQWEYSAIDFVDGADTPIPQRSVGGWLACDPCANCIQQNDWRGLAERGLLNPAAAILLSVTTHEEALSQIEGFHSKFRSHRNRKVTRFEGKL